MNKNPNVVYSGRVPAKATRPRRPPVRKSKPIELRAADGPLKGCKITVHDTATTAWINVRGQVGRYVADSVSHLSSRQASWSVAP